MAVTNRITGKLGRVYLTTPDGPESNWVADIFEWAAEFEIEAEPCGIKGEVSEVYSLGAFTGRVTAQRFSTTKDADAIFGAGVLSTAATAGVATVAVNKRVSYVLDQISGAFGSRITGTGIMRRGSINSPRAMALDTVEITMDSLPTIT